MTTTATPSTLDAELTFPDGPDGPWELTTAEGTFITPARIGFVTSGLYITRPGSSRMHLPQQVLDALSECQQVLAAGPRHAAGRVH